MGTPQLISTYAAVVPVVHGWPSGSVLRKPVMLSIEPPMTQG